MDPYEGMRQGRFQAPQVFVGKIPLAIGEDQLGTFVGTFDVEQVIDRDKVDASKLVDGEKLVGRFGGFRVARDAMQCELRRAQAEALRQLGRAPEAAAAVALTLAEKLHTADLERQTLPWIWALDSAGRADEALTAARQYVQHVTRNDYPTARWRREQTLARVLARSGHTRESVALIRQLLTLPSGLTVPMLRAEYDWDSLRDDPEFKALLADPKNSAPF